MKRNTNSLLRGVQVAAPCHESWDAMPGTDQVRSCERCQHKVYNLSEMSASEAETLLRNSEGRLCVRFYRRMDGTVMTKDCPVGTTAIRQKRIAQTIAGVAAAVGSAAAILHPNSEPSPTMGAPMALPMIQSTPAPRRDPFETVGKIARPEPRMGNVIMGARAVPTREVMGEMPVPEMGDVAASNPKTLSSNH